MKEELFALFSFFAVGFYLGQDAPRTDAWLGFGTLLLLVTVVGTSVQAIRSRRTKQ